MTNRFLNATEMATLTGKQAASAQRRALDLMRVRYIVRPDGKPMVLHETLLGAPVKKVKTPKWQNVA